MVKVILCRFVKSQVDTLSLMNALKNAAKQRPGLAQPTSLRKAKAKAARIATALTKALNELDGSASTCTFGFLVQSMAVQNAATEEELEVLMDHFQEKLRRQKLQEPEVIALRGYTGPLFVKMNGSLRKVSGRFPEEMTKHLKGNTYVNLIFACSSGMRKLSQAPSRSVALSGAAWVASSCPTPFCSSRRAKVSAASTMPTSRARPGERWPSATSAKKPCR